MANRHELLAALNAISGVTAAFSAEVGPAGGPIENLWKVPVDVLWKKANFLERSTYLMWIRGADKETSEANWAGKIPEPLRPPAATVVPIATEHDVIAYVNSQIVKAFAGQRVIDPRLDINENRVIIRGYFPVAAGVREDQTWLLYPKNAAQPPTGNNIAYDRVRVAVDPVV